MLGSRARSDRPADDWSDLDLVVFTSDPERLLSQADWLEQLGTPWVSLIETAATGGLLERRVLFAGGLDVDFIPVPAALAQQFAASGPPPEIAGVFRRGARVVLDKDEHVQPLLASVGDPPALQPPTPDEFLNLVSDFWYHAVWTAKKLRRGELWVAKQSCDSYMKHLLLAMLEWHARAASGWRSDTWHNGRFLEQWADPRAVEGLRGAFAHYDEADVARALLATMDLFRWLARETAERLGYPYPAAADQHATALVQEYLSEHV